MSASSGARLLLSSPSLARNLLCLSGSFLLMFTSYQGLAALQSSINSVGGLGTAGLAVTYACVVPSSLLISPLALGWFGAKRTMLLGMLGYVVYFCLSLAPGWATIIPGSALLGLCGAPLWAGMSLYTVQLADSADAEAAANKLRQSGDEKGAAKVATLPVFFGVFFTIVTSCNIWGNLISYLTLVDRSGGGSSNSTDAVGNFSCGYRFCPAKPIRELVTPANNSSDDEALGPGGLPAVKFYTLMSCFIAAAVVSVLIMLFLVDKNDPIKTDDVGPESQGQPRLFERVRKALAQLVDLRQLLLAPLTINAGLSQAFSLGDFTEGFVACSSGIAAVGLVMISYGVSQVVAGLLAGQAAARVGPAPVLLTTLIGLLAMEVGSLFWEVLPQPEWPLYAMAAAWGAVDSVWVTLLNALYGDYFADNAGAAFSALRFWQSLGFIIGFSYNKLLCIEQKLYTMIGLLCLSVVTFVICLFVNKGRSSRVIALQQTHGSKQQLGEDETDESKIVENGNEKLP